MSEPPFYFEVVNWSEFQHYRDRRPQWIKVYNALQDNYQFASLPDAAKGQLIGIWLVASRLGNCIPWDAGWLASKINATAPIDLDRLLAAGFIKKINAGANPEQIAPDLFHTRPALASVEIETERETEGNKTGRQAGRFAEFWKAYPRKVKKLDAHKVWVAKQLDAKTDLLLADIRTRIEEDHQWKRGYIPHPTTYLRGERWRDEIAQPERRP